MTEQEKTRISRNRKVLMALKTVVRNKRCSVNFAHNQDFHSTFVSNNYNNNDVEKSNLQNMHIPTKILNWKHE